jgi:hypothetical protein
MVWLKRLAWITAAYIAIGLVVGFSFFALSDFDMDWSFGNLKLFFWIVLAWPLWVWFIVVMYLSSRK